MPKSNCCKPWRGSIWTLPRRRPNIFSATERLSYVKESYNLIDEQFSLGMKNTLELLTEKNNYLTAQQEQLQAKYMALMSVQLLNVYQKKSVAENY